MKTLFFVLILWSAGFTAPNCFGDYTPLISRVEKTHIKAKANYERAYQGEYIYKFFSASLFPLFCASDKPDFSKYQLQYFCSFETNIYVRKDGVNQYLAFSILQYNKQGGMTPYNMVYTMYFYSKNKYAPEWVEEKKPLVVVLTWNPKLGQYISR